MIEHVVSKIQIICSGWETLQILNFILITIENVGFNASQGASIFNAGVRGFFSENRKDFKKSPPQKKEKISKIFSYPPKNFVPSQNFIKKILKL